VPDSGSSAGYRVNGHKFSPLVVRNLPGVTGTRSGCLAWPYRAVRIWPSPRTVRLERLEQIRRPEPADQVLRQGAAVVLVTGVPHGAAAQIERGRPTCPARPNISPNWAYLSTVGCRQPRCDGSHGGASGPP
jgi:hypothetical protein